MKHTTNGALVESVLEPELFQTLAMHRGTKLEPIILQKVQDMTNLTFTKIRLILKPDLPIFGASPDEICSEYVVEIKSPLNAKSMSRCVCQIQEN